MTALEAPNRRESHKAMEEKMTTARRVFRQVKAGRPPADSKPGLIEAVHLGRSIANKLYQAALHADLGPNDVSCVFVCAQAGTTKPVSHVLWPTEQDSHDLIMAKAIYDLRAEPIGIAFYIEDHESPAILLHARPFERTERSEQILAAALDDIEKGIAAKAAGLT
jgi:hypothetical protein